MTSSKSETTWWICRFDKRLYQSLSHSLHWQDVTTTRFKTQLICVVLWSEIRNHRLFPPWLGASCTLTQCLESGYYFRHLHYLVLGACVPVMFFRGTETWVSLLGVGNLLKPSCQVGYRKHGSIILQYCMTKLRDILSQDLTHWASPVIALKSFIWKFKKVLNIWMRLDA